MTKRLKLVPPAVPRYGFAPVAGALADPRSVALAQAYRSAPFVWLGIGAGGSFQTENMMMEYHVTGVSDDVILSPDGVQLTVHTEDGPMGWFIPLATAEALLVRLRAAADDVHRLRQDRGDPLGKAVVSADQPPLDTVGCMATVIKDGRILLQFRHASAATTALLVSRQGASILAKALADMAGAMHLAPKR
jgi:hypothetical protein